MKDYQPYLDWIDSQAQHMVHLTERWSRINSGSFHLEGLAAQHKALEDNFLWLHGQMESLELAPMDSVDSRGEAVHVPLGRALRVRKRPEAKLQVFLGGHMDTVFGKDHSFQEPRYLDSNTLNGPGVADLKGGLVVMLKALEALERSPWAEKIGWEVLINPDEEIGSLGSAPLLKEAAGRCQLGLVFEPALADGTLAGGRKGSGNFVAAVRGRAAHAGRAFDEGRNAIVLLAEFTQALYALNGQMEGVTINPGRISGGGAVNVVPDLAMLHFNVRVPDAAGQQWVAEKIDETVGLFRNRNDYSLALHGGFTRPAKPLEGNLKLFELVAQCGAMLGQKIAWKNTGGCCDGNNLYAYGMMNVDTLGVRGGKIHSEEEFVLLDSLPERAKLSALLLMRLASGDVNWSV